MGRSCADLLHKIQKDVGLSEDELKEAVHRVKSPKIMPLKEFTVDVEKSRQEREEREHQARKYKKKQRYEIATNWLFVHCTEDQRNAILDASADADEALDIAYRQAMDTIQVLTFVIRELDPSEVFPEEHVYDPHEIPEEHWKAFGKYIKKHPLKPGESMFRRRERFLDKIEQKKEKKLKKYYSPNALKIYDPYYLASMKEEEEFLKDLKRIGAENEERIQQFHGWLDSLFEDPNNGISPEVMKRFDKHSKNAIANHRRRVEQYEAELEYRRGTETVYEDIVIPEYMPDSS